MSYGNDNKRVKLVIAGRSENFKRSRRSITGSKMQHRKPSLADSSFEKRDISFNGFCYFQMFRLFQILKENGINS